MTPKRIQLRRTKGWRKPDGCLVVSRPTRWGNPARVVRANWLWYAMDGKQILDVSCLREDASETAVIHYRRLLLQGALPITVDDVRRELRDHDLACWCPIDFPCHADVLLEIANR